jgi:hypothetical protein
MKKIIILSLLAFSAFAQNQTQWGVKIGASVSKTAILNTQNIIIPKFRQDINVGFFRRMQISKFVIQPELYYQVKGGTFSATDVVKNNYQYLSVPLLLGYEITDGLTIQAGPEYSWALNANKKYGPTVKNDLGISAGIHFDFLDMASLFSLELRYTQGLTDINSASIPDYRNRTIQASLHYNLSDYYKWWKKHGDKKILKLK